MMNLPQNQNDQPIPHDSGADWQVLGELELHYGADASAIINAWLPELLASLQLHVDFLNKILVSVEEAVSRAMQNETRMNDQHIHLLIYIPASPPSNTQAWGFFRIEKAGTGMKKKNPCNHLIEFYLYLEE